MKLESGKLKKLWEEMEIDTVEREAGYLEYIVMTTKEGDTVPKRSRFC